MPYLTRRGTAALQRRDDRLIRTVSLLHAERARLESTRVELLVGLRQLLTSAEFESEAESPLQPEEEVELVVKASTILELRALVAKHGEQANG